MVEVGQIAPDFQGPASDGSTVQLSKLRGHPVILYFFPKADTPGCTIESKGFRDHFDELGGRDVRVIGSSVDSLEDEKAFAKKYGFQFPIVADPTKKIATSYGVLGPGGSARRVTFLIGADGKVLKVIEGKPENHVNEACAVDWTRGSGRGAPP
jgi:thioredoxin-dependent peroxiredoxin